MKVARRRESFIKNGGYNSHVAEIEAKTGNENSLQRRMHSTSKFFKEATTISNIIIAARLFN